MTTTELPSEIPIKEHVMRRYLISLASVAVMIASGCTGSAGDSAEDEHGAQVRHEHSDHGQHVHPDNDVAIGQVDDPYATVSLREVSEASDIVLTGAVEARREGPEIDGLRYSVLTIRTITAVRGDVPTTVDVIMSTQTENGTTFRISGRPTVSEDESLWMLTRVDPQFDMPTTYVLTGPAGVIPARDGKIIADDLETPAVREAMGVSTLDEVVELLRAD